MTDDKKEPIQGEITEDSPEIQCVAAEHFLPDLDDCGDLNARMAKLIEVPIRRVESKLIKSNDDLPYEVLACTWYHYDDHGPLTEAKFNEDLDGAMAHLATFIDERGEFRAYPFTIFPPTSYGRAYHDWVGDDYPFDLRLIIEYGQINPNEEAPEELDPMNIVYGLKFHLSTLYGKDG